MTGFHVIPAIIAKDQEELTGGIEKVAGFVDWIQLDFMDGVFVPNKSIDFDFQLPETGCRFEAHLMVDDPVGWVKSYGGKVDTILAHYESNFEPKELFEIVAGMGKKMGLVLNPETPVDAIIDYLDDISQVLVMTVNPGYYGSPFLPEALEKAKQLRGLKPGLDIEVDGGITDETISTAFEAGANMFVSGSYILKAEHPGKALKNLKEKIEIN